ncbi:ABC transporter G family member 3 [Zea mays]|nr:ABC transporter G family member 3 [Zea mays]
MGMGHYMRGAPPPPPMTVAPPFMGPPPPPVSSMRPYAGPMMFHDMPSPMSPVSPIYFYGPPPPEALRGLPLAPPMVGPPAYPYFQAQPEPEPQPDPEPDAEEERVKLLKQIEFYFSKENLCSDVYLRQQMDGQGWVDLSLIAGFKKVQGLKKDLQYIKETVQSSSVLEMKDNKIRKHGDWEKWVIPRESNPDAPSRLASVSRPNVNNLTSHLGGMGLHESASSTGAEELNHHDVVQNGSPSGGGVGQLVKQQRRKAVVTSGGASDDMED